MKTFNTNQFKDNYIFSWDDNDSGVVVIKKNAYTTAYDREFMIDNNAMNVIDKLGGIDNCDITLKDNNVIIKKGKVKVKALIKDVPVPSLDLEDLQRLNLRYNIKKALPFTDLQNIKNGTLSAVQARTTGSIVATDSYWAFQHKEAGGGEDISINVSAAFIKLLGNSNYKYTYNKHVIVAEDDDYKIIGRLIAGAYPDTTKVFQYQAYEPFAVYDRQELINALDLAMLADGESNCVILSDKGIRLLSGNFNSDLKTINESVFEVAVNIRMLKAIVKEFTEENIEMYCYGDVGLNPIVFRDTNNNDTYILLPIRVKE